jgi:hypothetical protein
VLKASLALLCEGSEFMYNENDSVFYYDAVQNKFNLLYVFNASIGQSWSMPYCYNQYGGNEDSLTITVKDKYTTTFDTVDVLTYKVEWNMYWNPTPYDTIIYENIGSAASMYMMGILATVHSGIRGLRCYDSPTTGLINFLGEPCGQIVSTVEEFNKISILEIYPTPVGDLLKYKINHHSSVGKNSVRIFNLIGNVIHEKENIMISMEQEVQVIGWSAGIYLMQYINDGKLVETKRFVVTR